MSFYLSKKAPVKDAMPPPQKGAARFFYLLITQPMKLIWVNLLFILFCLPVVTAPAALSGLNRVCLLLVREGTAYVWTDFIMEFRASFFKSIAVFVGCAVTAPAAWLCLYVSRSIAQGMTAFILIMLAVLALGWSLLMLCYAFPMLALCSLRAKEILRNAYSLILLEPKADILLLMLVGGGTAVFAGLLPYSLPLAVGLFSLLALAANTIAANPLERRIVKSQNHTEI